MMTDTLDASAESARQKLVQYLRLEATGSKVNLTSDKLAALRADAGLDADEFRELAGVVREIEDLKRQAAHLDDCGKALSAARRELADYSEESERIRVIRQEQEARLRGECQQRAIELNKTQGAKWRAEAIETDHAELLGLFFNLDELELTDGANNLPGPGASCVRRGVSGETFRTQHSRRSKLCRALYARREKDYTDVVKGIPMFDLPDGSRRFSKPLPPRPEKPSWGEVCEHLAAGGELEADDI